MTTEYGVRSRYSNGATHIRGGFPDQTAAERIVTAAGDAKCWHPAAEAVMVRDVSEWREVGSDEATT